MIHWRTKPTCKSNCFLGPNLWEQGYIIIIILVKHQNMLFWIFLLFHIFLYIWLLFSLFTEYFWYTSPNMEFVDMSLFLSHTVWLFKVVFLSFSSCVYVYWSMNSFLSIISLGRDFLAFIYEGIGLTVTLRMRVSFKKLIFTVSSKQV